MYRFTRLRHHQHSSILSNQATLHMIKEKNESTESESEPESSSPSSKESTPPTPRTPPSEQFLQYGDIIQLFTRPVVDTPSTIHVDLHEKTFLVDYVDDDKIRIINTTTFDTILLHMDDEGRLKEPSIRHIDLLTRSKEPGFARQKGLIPEQWIDIFFIGMEKPLTGKITGLAEDQIEVKLHSYSSPEHDDDNETSARLSSNELIYIDFSYRGIPEELGIERFVLRSAPPTSSLAAASAKATAEAKATGEDSELEEGEIEEASIEYTPESEIILRLPEESKMIFDPTVNERLAKEYMEADEIIFGKDVEHVEKYVEEVRYEMVFNIDTQLTSLMNELLSRIPNVQRTHQVTNDVHRLLDRFRELREQHSLMDSYTHQVLGWRLHGNKFQPLVDYLVSQSGLPISWLLPVTQTRRVMYHLPNEHADEFEDVGDVVVRPHDIDTLQELYVKYSDNSSMNRVVNPYRNWIESLEPPFQPTVTTPITFNDGPTKPVLFSLTVHNDRWESILDNAVGEGNLNATAVKSQKNHTLLESTHMAIQRFNDGGYFLEKSSNNARVFTRQPLLTNANGENRGGETMGIQSWITLPTSVMQFSKIYLPTLDLMQRTSMSQQYWLKYRSFPPRGKQPAMFVIDDVATNHFSTAPGTTPEIENYLQGIQHFVLDPVLARNHVESGQMENLYRDYVKSMIPSTFDLVEIIQSWWKTPFEGLSLRDMVRAMEPFKIYLGEITFLHFDRIRFFMKNRTIAYKTEFALRQNKYVGLNKTYTLLSSRYTTTPKNNVAQRLLDKDANYTIFMEAYHISSLDATKSASASPSSSTEIVQTWMRKDMGALFALLLRHATIDNVVSDGFLKAAAEENEDEPDENTKFHAAQTDCKRYFLTKLYTSLAELQKDNHRGDVYYDKEFDDTPYDLLKEYASDLPSTKETDSREMKEFLAKLSIILVKKHGVSRDNATELAETLVAKKKLVKENQHAILQIPFNFEKKPDETFIANDVGVDSQFYKRIKNQWVRDSEVDEESFVRFADLVNTAFPGKKTVNMALCNAQSSCVKNARTSMCESVDASKRRIQVMRQQYAVKEMEKRLDMSHEELVKLMGQLIVDGSRSVKAKERLQSVLETKASLTAYAMGQARIQAHDQVPIVVSPYAKLRDDILGQDFDEKQYNIVEFCKFESKMTRKAMMDELGEDIHWLYCTQTNTKLMPIFLYDLAKEYVSKGQVGYQAQLEKTKKFQMISDDGDAIVDKHSGYEIAKIQQVNEEEFDEEGHIIQTGGVLNIDPEPETDEQDQTSAAISDDLHNVLHAQRLKPIPMRGELAGEGADTEISQMVKNIFATFCNVMDISSKEYEKGGFKLLVIRLSLEFIDNFIQPQDMKETKKRHQYVVLLTTAAFLIGIQTSNPPIRAKKTVPGCVKSFTGYPMTESTEDQSGIQYLTCVLNLVRSSIPPWNALQKIKKDTIQEKLREIIAMIFEMRPDIAELYVKQRTYRAEHADEFVLPDAHQLQKWRTLLPPTVPIDIVDRLPRERPPIEPARRGNIESHLIRYGYGIVETIHQVVRSKDVLLKTMMGIPYIQNACCNDHKSDQHGAPETTLQYFIREAPVLRTFLDHMNYFQQHLDLQQQRRKSSTMVFVDDTRIRRAEVTSGDRDEIVYAAFIHFCHFDRLDVDIPAHLLTVCATKPADDKYNRRGTLAEKIQALKHMGRTFLWEDFEQLIRLVNLSNRILSDFQFTPPSAVNVLTEFLSSSNAATITTTSSEEEEEENIIRPRKSVTTAAASEGNYALANPLDLLRNELLAVLVKYDPQIMILEQSSLHMPEPGSMDAAMNDLYNVVGQRNIDMKTAIKGFIHSKKDKERATTIMNNLTKWNPHMSNKRVENHEELYEMSQFVQNAVVYAVKVLPHMISAKQFSKELVVPEHWKLGDKHKEIITKFMRKMHDRFAKLSTDNGLFLNLLREWRTGLLDMVRFVQLLPIQLPIQKEQTFYRLFSLETVIELMNYAYLSLLNRMVDLCKLLPKTNDGDNVRKTAQMWVMSLLDMWDQDKTTVDLSYEQIMKKVNKSKESEKRHMIDEFNNAAIVDRKYMFLEKIFKHGRFNVNTQELTGYNVKRFDKEYAEFVDEEGDEGREDFADEEGEEPEEYGGDDDEEEDGYNNEDENEYDDEGEEGDDNGGE